MRIELKLYASLARFMPHEKAGVGANTLEIDEGTTISELLESLKVPTNHIKLIFLNGVNAKGDHVLKEGDRVGVFPPVAGG